MQIRDYLSVRRAYNLVRQQQPVAERITFEECCALCHLAYAKAPILTSNLADYQRVLRPTMTHRTGHLAKLGYILRESGTSDKRNICCSITKDGQVALIKLAEDSTHFISTGMPLAHADAKRLLCYIDAMGRFYIDSADLILIALNEEPDAPQTISSLIDTTGLLQPTVSMAITHLNEVGLVQRNIDHPDSERTGRIVITEEGISSIFNVVEEINNTVVHRLK